MNEYMTEEEIFTEDVKFFVMKNISKNVTDMVSILKKNEDFSDQYDLSFCSGRYEFRPGAIRWLSSECNRERLLDILSDIGAREAPTQGKSIEELIGMIIEITDKEDPRWFGFKCDDDIEETPAAEWWLVSDFLAKKLRERGEGVLFDFFGLKWNIWGRVDWGQALYRDQVLRDIYSSLSEAGT